MNLLCEDDGFYKKNMFLDNHLAKICFFLITGKKK